MFVMTPSGLYVLRLALEETVPDITELMEVDIVNVAQGRLGKYT